MHSRLFHSFSTLLLFLVLAICYTCGKESPLNKALRDRRQYQVEVLSWAVIEGKTIAANIRLIGPMRSSLKYITVRFDQLDNNKSLIRKDWIPFDLSELEGLGAKEFTLSIECGNDSVSQLAAMVDYEPSFEDMKNLKELEGLI